MRLYFGAGETHFLFFVEGAHLSFQSEGEMAEHCILEYLVNLISLSLILQTPQLLSSNPTQYRFCRLPIETYIQRIRTISNFAAHHIEGDGCVETSIAMVTAIPPFLFSWPIILVNFTPTEFLWTSEIVSPLIIFDVDNKSTDMKNTFIFLLCQPLHVLRIPIYLFIHL